MSPSNNQKVLRVGLIGCGEVSQVVHIPTLSYMSDWFRITYLCDVSALALEHCASKVAGARPQTTANPEDLCASNDVDVVLVVSSDEYHSSHAVCVLQHNKHVFVEKPVALTSRDIQTIMTAEKSSKAKAMVGYMRRYASPFEDAVKEIGGLDKILYARVRDFKPEDATDKSNRAKEMIAEAFEKDCGGILVTDNSTLMWRILAGLGSHDLSVMREALGMPDKVVGTSLGFPFWTAIFQYPGFAVSYESGMDNIPRFDAHLEVYSNNKTVRVQYDTPYVKGLPVTMHIVENVDGAYRESTIRKSYEDPYTLELVAFWKLVVEGQPVKTTVADALKDIEISGMIMKHGYGEKLIHKKGD
ncbi:unnamed protein product [Clonostachys chloroleuca]|uniref:Gfo/Idh/MocA-like oxidoreductase N-terminal domain-containing protein n=1 Tax=Clonostachys chloroleuca TaxID=1926264 RepID=A0AA35VRQ7_9HYPO|nr:unnamed protein product [Clonostachys chloroleuca]